MRGPLRYMSSEEMVTRIRRIVNNDLQDLGTAIAELINWVPGDNLLPLLEAADPDREWLDDPAQIELMEKRKMPFFTEAVLYPLLGKEDARGLLAYLHAVARAAGREDLNDDWLYPEEAEKDLIDRLREPWPEGERKWMAAIEKELERHGADYLSDEDLSFVVRKFREYERRLAEKESGS